MPSTSSPNRSTSVACGSWWQPPCACATRKPRKRRWTTACSASRRRCATHKDLAAEVGAGRFRQDLYYRLNVIELRVPPLRERREDIPLLAERILKRLAGDTGLPAARLTGDAQEKLKNYRFPGNVRELENMLERAYTLCEDDQIQPHDLRLADAPGASQEGAASLSEIDNLEDYLEDIERKLIMQALEETRWNRTAAAQRLGLTFRSMRYRLKKLGID